MRWQVHSSSQVWGLLRVKTVTFVKHSGRDFSGYVCTVGVFDFLYSLENFLNLVGLLEKES